MEIILFIALGVYCCGAFYNIYRQRKKRKGKCMDCPYRNSENCSQKF